MPIGLNLPQLALSVCESKSCDSFDINETTGLYPANAGGYDITQAVNYDVANVIDARLEITLPDGTVVAIDSNSPIPVYPTLPDSSGLVPFTVTNTMLGLTGSLPDGLYKIKYQIDINNVFSQIQITDVVENVLFTCSLRCCIDKMFSKIPIQNCDCDSSAVKNALLASALYSALCSAAKCGNITAVDNLMDRLNKLCNVTSCNCN